MPLVDLVTVLPWSESLPLGVYDVGPRPGRSARESPGPRRKPTRPRLHLAHNAQRLAGFVALGNGESLPTAVLVDSPPRMLPLQQPPFAVCPSRDGGVWALSEDRVSRYAADGTCLATLELSGQALAATSDGVWIIDVGRETVTFVSSEGHRAGPFGWPHGVHAVAGADGALYGFSRGLTPRLQCVSVSGEQAEVTPAVSGEPFERLLAYSAETRVTVAGTLLSWYQADGDIKRVSISNAGLNAEDEPFVAGRDASGLVVSVGHTPPRQLPVPDRFAERDAATVVAVAGERALVYGLDYASWYANGRPGEPIEIDDGRYRADIFPRAWSLDPLSAFAALADGTLYLTASGPVGIAVLKLRA
jgi:hypothetical protein